MVVKNNHEKLKMKNQYEEPHEKKQGNKTIFHACICKKEKKKAPWSEPVQQVLNYLLC